ncbi:MAG: hypothetical protein Q8P67_29290, partial [archaeon]|nr:hypothetical protein [archaeon]
PSPSLPRPPPLPRPRLPRVPSENEALPEKYWSTESRCFLLPFLVTHSSCLRLLLVCGMMG